MYHDNHRNLPGSAQILGLDLASDDEHGTCVCCAPLLKHFTDTLSTMAPTRRKTLDKHRNDPNLFYCYGKYGRCTFSSRSMALVAAHGQKAHPIEAAHWQRTANATHLRRQGIEGTQAIYEGSLLQQATELDLPAEQEAYRIRIACQQDLQAIIEQIPDPELRLQTRRRFDSPAPEIDRFAPHSTTELISSAGGEQNDRETSEEEDEMEDDGDYARVNSDDEDESFREAENIMTGMFGLDIQDSGFEVPLDPIEKIADPSEQTVKDTGSHLPDTTALEQDDSSGGFDVDMNDEAELGGATARNQQTNDSPTATFFSSQNITAGEEFSNKSEEANTYVVCPERTEDHPTGGRPVPGLKATLPLDDPVSPWAPFISPHDFKTGAWFVRNGATGKMVTDGFNRGILSQTKENSVSFSSPFTLKQLVDQMEPGMGVKSWKEGKAKFFADVKNEWKLFYYRDIGDVIRQLFKQPAYREHLVYSPVKEYNGFGDRVYSDIHTAEWWWRTQVFIPFRLSSVA